jgi:hypothetical protein
MIFVPPRHGKSLVSSEIYPASLLGKHPDKSVIAASYGAELATDFGRKMADGLCKAVFRGRRSAPIQVETSLQFAGRLYSHEPRTKYTKKIASGMTRVGP